MIGIALFLICQTSGDTLRWYDTTTVGYEHGGLVSGGYLHWAIILPIDSEYVGRTVHSGRVHIWGAMDSSGTMRLCKGDLHHPFFLLGSGTFHSTGYGFYEVFFGDSVVLHQGDYIWLWCTQWHAPGQTPATTDAGPCDPYYGSMVSLDGVDWGTICSYYMDYRWVMELILTPVNVEEGPAKPEGKLTLLPTAGGFWITGYEGPAQIYDPAGRLVLGKEIRGKTLISPLSPGVYFVIAGKGKARVAVR
jgi:hypothetical protein